MANLANIARPYARGAFDCARDKGQLAEWKAFLSSAATMAKQPSVTHLLDNPAVQPSELYRFFCDVLAVELNNERKHFLRLLADNKRYVALPAISDAFDAYYAALEKMANVRVVTAVAPSAGFLEKLKNKLTQRIQSSVTIKNEIDPSILGGAVIHLGDNVIDGSIRGKLTRLLEFSLR